VNDQTPTPEELATALGVQGRDVREWLRKEYPRPDIEYRTRWQLTEAMAAAAHDHFGKH
jgi:hypothetical protein